MAGRRVDLPRYGPNAIICPRCSGVGVIPNRQLKSATRSHPVTGGFGEIPEPTVKVRMRGTRKSSVVHRAVQRCALAHFAELFLSTPGY